MSASRRFLISALVVVSILTAAVMLRVRASRSAALPAPPLSAGSAHLLVPAPLASLPPAAPSSSSAPTSPRAVSSGSPAMLHLDPARTNRSPFLGPADPIVLWTFEAGAPIETAPAQLPDGTTVVGTLAGRVAAVTAEGRGDWSLDLHARIYGSPLIDRGTIYLGADSGKLVAISSNGKIRWQLDTDGEADTAAALAPWGAILMAAGKVLYAVRPGGNVLWRVKAQRKLYGSPAVGADGTVYVGSQDDRLYAVSREGKIRWSTNLGADVDCAPSVDDDGTVVAGADGGAIVALDGASGKVRWRAQVGGHVRGSLTITRAGVVVAGTYGPAPAVVAVDGATGRELWRFAVRGTGATEFGVHGSPVEDAAGNLYFGAQDDVVYSLTGDGRLRWRVGTGGDVDAPVILAGNGRLLAASDDGKLYCVVDREASP